MKTIRNYKMVEMLLNKAREHVQLATEDLDYADMALEEIHVAVRISKPKKGYTIMDVINEIYEYTGVTDKNSLVSKYMCAINDFKLEYKHSDSVKQHCQPGATSGKGFRNK